MKKCPYCGRVNIADKDKQCINCEYKNRYKKKTTMRSRIQVPYGAKIRRLQIQIEQLKIKKEKCKNKGGKGMLTNAITKRKHAVRYLNITRKGISWKEINKKFRFNYHATNYNTGGNIK